MRVLALAVCLMTPDFLAHAKTARTFYDEPMMARVRRLIATQDWAQRQAAAACAECQWLVSMSDQELWDFVPPPEQMRAINVHIGHDCPTCGQEITRKGGHYPWLMDRARPFKVKCPVCGQEFPSNDFRPWNPQDMRGAPETGPVPVDTGLGWLGPDGRRYYFVAYYVYWQRWVRDVLGGLSALAHAYLLAGEPLYAHKCAVILAKIASEYDRFDYANQAYHEGLSGIRGRISDYIWSTGDDTKMALAYDAIFPALKADSELRTFLRGKGIDDPARFIETKLLHVMVDDVMRGYVAGNMGMHQQTLCYLAIVLDNDDPAQGPTTAQMRDWLLSGPGRIEDLLWNGFHRDGLGGESSPGYSMGWNIDFYELADLLPRIGVDIWSNPKLKKMADIPLELTVAGEFTPSIGDSGALLGSRRVGWSAALLGRGFAHFRDPRHAKALALIGATSRSLWQDLFDEAEVARVVQHEGTDLGLRTRNLGGYGLAVLESGAEGHRRGASLYYGDASGGHGHHDRLTIELFAHGRPMLPDDGYPVPFTRHDFHHWRSDNTVRHYCVMVNEATQATLHRGQLNTLATSPHVQLMDASAEVAYPGTVSLYRRTTALVDISPEESYLLDIFRVRGGLQHDWCFHGPPFPEFSLAGAELGPARTRGTLAGEDVPYGAVPPPFSLRKGVALNLLGAEGVLPGDYQEASREGWARLGTCVLTRRQGAAITVKLSRSVPAGKVRVFMHIYDYNRGSNEVSLTLRGTTLNLRCDPSGAEGYRWVSGIGELAQPADQVVIASAGLGQEYLQIDCVVVSTDITLLEPDTRASGTSGFQGLFNVRRGRPAGAWSVTWRKPDEDLALTMTMPAGCAQEVIVADGEPEAQPGNPRTMQYLLARNVLPEETAAEGGLLSKYVAVVEPHRGPATVQAVQHLRGEAPGTAVGLCVARGEVMDLVHSALEPTRECRWQTPTGDELLAAGEFALLTLDPEGVQRAFLVNGTVLQWGDFALRPAPSPAGKVLAIDRQRNAITVDCALAQPQAYEDAVVILGNELHQTSYTITEARVADGRTTLMFGDVLFVVGMGCVESTDQAGYQVVAHSPLAGYGHVDGGRHAGRWLYNEDWSRGFRIVAVDGNSFRLDRTDADLAAVFTDLHGDGRRQFWISDIGPGDTFRIPAATHVERIAPHQYEVRMMTPTELTLPASSDTAQVFESD